MLTAYVVNSLADTVANDGLTTLREAIQAASNNTALWSGAVPAGSSSSMDYITFDEDLFTDGVNPVPRTIIFASGNGQFAISGSAGTTIQGPGANLLTINANGQSRAFDVLSSARLNLSGLTITGGRIIGSGSTPDDGGGIRMDFYSVVNISDCVLKGNSAPRTAPGLIYGFGGAISSAGTLTILDSTVEDNSASNSGGAIYISSSSATTTIRRTTFSGNSAPSGAGIASRGTMNVENSVFAANIAGGIGNGGAIKSDSGTLTLVNCAVFGNTAVFGGAVLNYATLKVVNSTITRNFASYGGGIDGSGTVSVANSIIANNTASTRGPDVDGTVISQGHNLIGNVSGSTGFGVAGDLLNAEPGFVRNPSPGVDGLWGTEDDEWGSLLLATGSLAIDAGSNAFALDAQGNPLTVDLDGNPRIANGTVDIGAHEFSAASLVVADDHFEGLAAGVSHVLDVLANDVFPSDAVISVEVIDPPMFGAAAANPDGTVTYSSYYGFRCSDMFSYAMLIDGLPVEVAEVSVGLIGEGPIPVSTIVDASNSDYSPGDLSLREALGLAGDLPGGDMITFTPSLNGQSILLEQGQLVVDSDVTIQGPGANLLTIDADQQSRVVDVLRYARLNLSGLTITGGRAIGSDSDMSSDEGGGIRMDFYSVVNISDCVLKGNSAPRTAPGLVYGVGGAISSAGTLTILDSTVEDNSASNSGGAIYISSSSATTTIRRTTFSGNSAPSGAGISSYGTMNIESSVFAANIAGGIGNGGAITNDSGTLTLVNCAVFGNTAVFGGAVLNYATLKVVNSTITRNFASYGGGIDGFGTVSVANSIIANNTTSTRGPEVDGTVVSLGHNLIGDVSGSTGFGAAGDLLNAEPCLVRIPSEGVDGIWGTEDDDYGDVHLRAESPAVNAGDNALAMDASGNPLVVDLDGNPRVIYGMVDIGAIEHAVPGDANIDFVVDDADATLVASHWRKAGSWADGDFNGDGLVNDKDASIMAAHWHAAAPGTTPGDANVDGVVNDLDAAVLATHWRKNGGWLDGDFNDDGLVDDRDASIMAAHWGETAEQQTPVVVVETPANVAVDEPAVVDARFIGPRQAPASMAARRRIEPYRVAERAATSVAAAHDVALSEISNAESLDYRLSWSYVMTSQQPQRRKTTPRVALAVDLVLMDSQ